MKIKEIFYVKTGRRIIEEDVYMHQGNFPCVTSQTAKNGITWYADSSWINKLYGDFVVNEPCITWTKDGAKCGTMFFRDYAFYPNDHCGVLIPKDKFKSELNLEWFIYEYQNEIKSNVNQQGSQGMLYNEEMAEIDIEYPFPILKKQNFIVEQIRKLNDLNSCISTEINKINEIINRELILSSYTKLKVSKIALLNKGSSRISEEMIYKNFDKDGIPVYSSATENEGLMGSVSKKCYDDFEKKGNAEELTWTTNGYAGVVFYRPNNYLYSEKCGRIVMRKKYKNLINVKYLCYILNQITYKYKTSESNNGKLDIVHMLDIPVLLPVDKNGRIDLVKQNEIVELYDKLTLIKNGLMSESNKINHLIG